MSPSPHTPRPDDPWLWSSGGTGDETTQAGPVVEAGYRILSFRVATPSEHVEVIFMQRIAVIGAGLAGISFARELREYATVEVFEKARGLGGRMTTRRRGGFRFNHGAQFFTARSAPFKRLLDRPELRESFFEWRPKIVSIKPDAKPYKRLWFEPHYVGRPGMNGLVKAMATGIDVRLQTRIESIDKVASGWSLGDAEGNTHGPFDWVVCSAPPFQTQALMPEAFHESERLVPARFSGCHCLMVGFGEALETGFEIAMIENSPIAWISKTPNEGANTSGDTLLAHTDNRWSDAHLEDDLEQVKDQLVEELMSLLGHRWREPTHVDLHLWRFARCEASMGADFLLDADNHLAVCGDGCRGNRVEDAFLSGHALAQALRTKLA
jgi:renalase